MWEVTRKGILMGKILIVEDETLLADVIKKRMEDQGHTVAVTYDAYGGVSQIHKEVPDLVILDLMLPAGGGLHVLRNMKNSDHTKNVPVIVLTGMQNEEYKKQILDLGVTEYLDKPYNPQQLTEAVNRALESGSVPKE